MECRYGSAIDDLFQGVQGPSEVREYVLLCKWMTKTKVRLWLAKTSLPIVSMRPGICRQFEWVQLYWAYQSLQR